MYQKSRNIKIPQKDRLAEYTFDGIRGVFTDLSLVPFDRPPHVGTSTTKRLAKIDMALIRVAKGYDKLGYQLFIPALKEILFGNRNARILKKRAEDFFDDPGNFVKDQ